MPGVFAIATVVDYLRRWSTEIYWAWFKKNILDFQVL